MTIKNQAIQTALKGNWSDAISLNKNLIKDDPEDIDALNRLSFAYTITGKLKEAKSTYQKVLTIDPLNPIALRNLKKLKDKNFKQTGDINSSTLINNNFLEEPGRTKIVELVNIAQPKTVEGLKTGQTVELSVKRLKIFVSEQKQYIGVLPDDIARRLIKFMKGGCIYDAYVKSSSSHKVTVFIKEVKKTGRFKDQPSFVSTSDTPFTLDRNGRIKNRLENQKSQKTNEDTETEEDYSEEE